MKIDLHVHTLERSPCAVASEEEQIITAIERGLDAIVITDHGQLVPQAQLDALNSEYTPFRIFGGVEITLQEKEDILVLGIHDPAITVGPWTYPDLHAFVREREGWMALAHPYRYRPTIAIDLERYPLDAIEGCSVNVPLLERPRIYELAAHLSIPVVCNSDAHATRYLGVAYNILQEIPGNERALLNLLRSGAFRGVCTLA
ncbi:MAG: PHP domain-containing protein [Anaerolineae bacterium]|nr:PHP domain-containing protein [Anaerolineae bacterium]